MNSYDHIDSVVRSYKEGKYVPDHEFKSAIESIFAEDVSDKSIASLLLALNTATIGLRELKIIRKVLLYNSIKITPKNAGIIIDNCGTGGLVKHLQYKYCCIDNYCFCWMLCRKTWKQII